MTTEQPKTIKIPVCGSVKCRHGVKESCPITGQKFNLEEFCGRKPKKIENE